MVNKGSIQRFVFVTQYVSNVDVHKAEKFGEVVFCTTLDHKAEPTVAEKNNRIRIDLNQKVSGYVRGVDYILLSSSAIPNFVMGSLLEKGEHLILKWSNQDKEYRLHKVTI